MAALEDTDSDISLKLALITDTHYGARSDNIALMDYYKRFLDDVFFPYIKEHNIEHVIHLGDLVDRRKFININTAHRMRKDFLWPLRDLACLYVIAGNHDCYFKDTNEVNALDELLDSDVLTEYYTRPVELNWGEGCDILFLPWICPDNYEESMNAVQNTKASVCFGHLELKGFEMHKGSFCEHGLEESIFRKFELVASGHFHHKSTYQNINYLGCPWQITWADYSDTKGFHIFDTETRELEFIENPFKLFNKVTYDDEGKSFEDVMGQSFHHLKDTYVKVIVKSKTNPYWYDQFIQRLEELPVINVQAVDDHLNLNLETDDEIIDQAESTIDILKKAVKQVGIEEKYEKPLELLLHELYNEASLMEA